MSYDAHVVAGVAEVREEAVADAERGRGRAARGDEAEDGGGERRRSVRRGDGPAARVRGVSSMHHGYQRARRDGGDARGHSNGSARVGCGAADPPDRPAGLRTGGRSACRQAALARLTS